MSTDAFRAKIREAELEAGRNLVARQKRVEMIQTWRKKGLIQVDTYVQPAKVHVFHTNKQGYSRRVKLCTLEEDGRIFPSEVLITQLMLLLG